MIHRFLRSSIASPTLLLLTAWVLAGEVYAQPLVVNTGDTLSPGGASPGTQSAGDTTWNGAGNYNWQLYDATGVAGIGYDLLDVTGTLDVSAASGFRVNLWTLAAIGPDVDGDAIHFTSRVARAWTLVRTTGGVTGFSANNFNTFDVPNNGTAGFANPRNGGYFTLRVVGNNLVLFFSPTLAAPAVTTQEASAITASNALFNGLVSPNGATTAKAYFEYGSTTSYGSFTPTNTVRSGLYFDGVDQHVSVPHQAAFNFTNAFTIETWVRTTNGVDQYLATKNEDSFYLAMGPTGTSPNKAAVALKGVSSAAWLEGTSELNDGRWHHVAATYDGVMLKLYVDGQLENGVPRSGSIATGSSPVFIGSRGSSGYFRGTLAQMRLWGAALDQATLQSYLNFGLLPSHPNFNQLRAYWPMNEESGTVLADASGNDNRAVLADGQTWTGSQIPVITTLTGLSPGSVYHYRVVGVNNAGTVVGADQTFTTLSMPPTATTQAASAVDSFGVTLNGLVNPNGAETAAHFEYGVDTSYGSRTPWVGMEGDITAQTASVTLGDLLPDTTYHYRLVATNSVGTGVGADLVFTTPMALPTATTLAATALTPSSAMLNASVKPYGMQTDVIFEYGFTTSYGSYTPQVSVDSGTVVQSVSVAVGDLLPGRIYHYRAVTVFYVGLYRGPDMTFRTPVPPPTIGPVVRQTGGAFQLQFSGASEATYNVFGSTNLIDWLLLGPAVENPPGTFQFTDSAAPDHAHRFYQLRWP